MHYLLNPAYAFILCFMARHCLAAVLHNRYNAKELYTKAHSLGANYQFSPRDGWHTVNVTNSIHTYRRQVEDTPSVETREAKHASSKKSQSNPKSVSKPKQKPKEASGGRFPSVSAAINKALTAMGKVSEVVITWYTGHDLENPSCWANGDWTPSDQAFVGAVTLEGWADRPSCLKFVELCSSPSKCVFVRIVDTCAGCAKGSQHVDLTKGAFQQLASLDDGKLSVKMRHATNPATGIWFADLWGPQK
ncbi:hypothetical protein BDN71DRAFT_1443276 [Pleurotus eryngii]|uniref:RlpA-like protein double-psi beta-barrel domain-containing protein n=1 Tax=Pleurotus eryngii TaxID=5323 RepID=A0A9P6A638_PLEER|nr:hypothetical protein BDN71DRAFT_1443276 [Pleurotus eryngii]